MCRTSSTNTSLGQCSKNSVQRRGAPSKSTHWDSCFSLKFLRYELGKDVFIAPYDWRLVGDAHAKRQNGVGGYYQQLQMLIESAVKAWALSFRSLWLLQILRTSCLSNRGFNDGIILQPRGKRPTSSGALPLLGFLGAMAMVAVDAQSADATKWKESLFKNYKN